MVILGPEATGIGEVMTLGCYGGTALQEDATMRNPEAIDEVKVATLCDCVDRIQRRLCYIEDVLGISQNGEGTELVIPKPTKVIQRLDNCTQVLNDNILVRLERVLKEVNEINNRVG